MRGSKQNGFTLVELMVVVTIIGVLAAIAVPRVFSYMRTSATAEVAQNASAIANAISGYAQSQVLSPATLKTQMAGTTATPDVSGTNEVSTIIPQVQLPRDSRFDFAIDAIVATAGPATGEVVYCMKATGRSNAAVVGGPVLYSSAATTAPGWDGRINRVAFVNGETALTGVQAGGYCSATGTAQATCTSC